MKRTIVIGGGTFSHVKTHLSLAAPAFGLTARLINRHLKNSELVLTKMADNKSNIVTSHDLFNYVLKLIQDETVGTIVFSAAVCDFDGKVVFAKKQKIDSNQEYVMNLTPIQKIIRVIRLQRPDIFLVGFKTSHGLSSDEQYYNALKSMKEQKCNLMLANDLGTKNNMVIVPEEAKYYESTSRGHTIAGLIELIKMRQNLTYHRTNLRGITNTPMSDCPAVFQDVIEWVISHGGFITDNGNGFTPGHFCYKLNHETMFSSQRKANHNFVFENGLSMVLKLKNHIMVYGNKKASVGATSQMALFDGFPNYDCIVHTHNPLKKESEIHTVKQHDFQCGSLECGMNTANNIKFYDGIGAVFLEKHGANILFRSTDSSYRITEFIKKNLQLGVKIK